MAASSLAPDWSPDTSLAGSRSFDPTAVGFAAEAPPSPTRRAALQARLPPWQRLRRALAVDPLAYLDGLGPLAPNARASSLQTLLLRRGGSSRQSPSSLCRAHLALCGTRLADLPTDRAGQLAPLVAGTSQCQLLLGKVKGVPPAGAVGRRPWRHVARLCLYDGAHFHGNAQAVEPVKVKQAGRGRGATTSWAFDAAAPLLVRCPEELLPKMQLYIELNISHELLPEEAARLPARMRHAAQQVDEVCVCWALLDLSTLPTLHSARSIAAPLRGGPLAARMTLQQCAAAGAAAGAAAALPAGLQAGAAAAAVQPSRASSASLHLTLRPVPAGAAAAAAALLPAPALATEALAQAMALYRQMLAEALRPPEGCSTPALAPPAADPVLAGFPALMDDADLAEAVFGLWRKWASLPPRGMPPPPAAELCATFRRCVAAVWALRGVQAVPQAGIGNHVAQRSHRRSLIQAFLQQHPGVGLGVGGHAWLHTPFNAAELRCGPLEALGATV